MKENKYRDLIIVDYTDLEDFMSHFVCANTIANNYEKDSVSLYANADTIYSAVKILLHDYGYDITDIGYIDLARFYYDEDLYGAEYCLKITDEGHICISKARNDDNFMPYRIFDEIAFFYQDECDQDLIDMALSNSENMVTLFGLGEDDEDDKDDGDEECCEYCGCEHNRDADDINNYLDTNESESVYISRDEGGRVLGFTKSCGTMNNGIQRYSSYSYYSDDLDSLKEVASKFDIEL